MSMPSAKAISTSSERLFMERRGGRASAAFRAPRLYSSEWARASPSAELHGGLLESSPRMNAANPDSTTAAGPGVPPPAATASASRTTLWLVTGVLLVIAVAGILGWLDSRREITQLRSDVARRLGAADAALAAAKSEQSDF